MIFYHIDRYGYLSPGCEIKLLRPLVNPHYLNEVLMNTYPDGLSLHGDQYFARLGNPENNGNAFLENIFEMQRQLHYPKHISRFQSMFATDSIESALYWLERLKSDRTPTVWEIDVQHDDYVKRDASWLKLDINKPSFLSAIHSAKSYWSGKFTDSPELEILIKLPARAMRKINPPTYPF